MKVVLIAENMSLKEAVMERRERECIQGEGIPATGFRDSQAVIGRTADSAARWQMVGAAGWRCVRIGRGVTPIVWAFELLAQTMTPAGARKDGEKKNSPFHPREERKNGNAKKLGKNNSGSLFRPSARLAHTAVHGLRLAVIFRWRS